MSSATLRQDNQIMESLIAGDELDKVRRRLHLLSDAVVHGTQTY